MPPFSANISRSSTQTNPRLPNEIISKIVHSIPTIKDDDEFEGFLPDEPGAPDYDTLRACLAVSSAFYVPAHEAIFAEVALTHRCYDPTALLHRSQLLADLVSLWEKRDKSAQSVMRSPAQDIRILFISTLAASSQSNTDNLNAALVTVIQHVARENKGQMGGKLHRLTIVAGIDSQRVPRGLGDFYHSSLQLASSKSIRDLFLDGFYGIPITAFSGCKFDELTLHECSFAAPTTATDGVETVGPAAISNLSWGNLNHEFGTPEQTALLSQSLKHVELSVALPERGSITPGRGCVPSSVFTSDIQLEEVYIQLEASFDNIIACVSGATSYPILSPEAMAKFHNIPKVRLDVVRVAMDYPMNPELALVSLCVLLGSVSGLATSRVARPMQGTSKIANLTLALSPTIFWPFPSYLGPRTGPGGVDNAVLAESQTRALTEAWIALDKLLSSSIYGSVEELSISLEGADVEGYAYACQIHSQDVAALAPKEIISRYLPKTMKVRTGNKSIHCGMSGLRFNLFGP